MTIAVGDTLPDVPLAIATPDGPQPTTSSDYFRGKRVALFAVGELAAHFIAKGWSDAWPHFAKKLRCSGTDGCGSSGPSVAWSVDAPPPDHDPTPPKPRLVRTPKKSPIGISQEDWEKAKTDRDRRRLIRIARD